MNKIKMNESDFIELVTNLAEENCCKKFDTKECIKEDYSNCWSKLMNKFIEY